MFEIEANVDVNLEILKRLEPALTAPSDVSADHTRAAVDRYISVLVMRSLDAFREAHEAAASPSAALTECEAELAEALTALDPTVGDEAAARPEAALDQRAA